MAEVAFGTAPPPPGFGNGGDDPPPPHNPFTRLKEYVGHYAIFNPDDGRDHEDYLTRTEEAYDDAKKVLDNLKCEAISGFGKEYRHDESDRGFIPSNINEFEEGGLLINLLGPLLEMERLEPRYLDPKSTNTEYGPGNRHRIAMYKNARGGIRRLGFTEDYGLFSDDMEDIPYLAERLRRAGISHRGGVIKRENVPLPAGNNRARRYRRLQWYTDERTGERRWRYTNRGYTFDGYNPTLTLLNDAINDITLPRYFHQSSFLNVGDFNPERDMTLPTQFLSELGTNLRRHTRLSLKNEQLRNDINQNPAPWHWVVDRFLSTINELHETNMDYLSSVLALGTPGASYRRRLRRLPPTFEDEQPLKRFKKR